MVRMDKLLEAWRADPKVDATVELCAMLIRAALKAAPQKLLPDPFVIGFANEARSKHPTNLDVAIAVADLHLISGLLTHAGAVLEMAEKLAPSDTRVRERLAKVRRRPTREFSTKTTDPETLDAPTTPLDPPTEPGAIDVLRAAMKGPGGRRPTTIGLPAAPPPLPAPPMDRRTKMGLAARASVVDVEEKTEGDTHTESTGAMVMPGAALDNPRRQKTFLFGEGGKEETAQGVPSELPVDDDSPPTKVDPTNPADAPITRVDAPGDDGPPTKVDPPAPAKVPGPEVVAPGLVAPGLAAPGLPAPQAPVFNALAPPGSLGLPGLPPPLPFPTPPAATPPRGAEPPLARSPKPSASKDDPLDAPSVVKGLPPVAPLSPDTSDDAPPTAVQPVSRESLALSEIAKPRQLPRTLSSEVSKPLAFSPARAGASPTERGAKVVAKTDPAWAKKTDDKRQAIKPTLLDSANLRRDDPREDRDDPPTKVEHAADSGNQPSKDPKLAARKPVAERRAVRPLPALDENAGEIPTKVAETPDALRGNGSPAQSPGARSSVSDGFVIPPPPPSDPETETTTKVREPEILAAEREALRRRTEQASNARANASRPLADHELGEPSTLSGAITNLWTPPPMNAVPASVAPVEEDSSVIELSRNELIEDDDEDEAVTGLKEPMPLLSAVASVNAKRDVVPSKGGTLAMQVSSPPSFPPVPPGSSLDAGMDEADNPRTKVLSAREAMTAAVTADPRPPHARSRQPAGMPSLDLANGSMSSLPVPMSAPVISRGMMVGAGSASQRPEPGPEVPLFAPPPASVPTFGAPPVRSPPVRPMSVEEAPDPLALAPLGAQGILQSQSMHPASLLQSGGYVAQQDPMLSSGSMRPMELMQMQQDPMLSSGSMRPMDFPAHQPSVQGPALSGAFLRPATERPTKLYVALALAVLAVTGLVAYAAHLLLRGEPSAADETTEQGFASAPIVDALSRATPASLASADVEITKLESKPSAALAKLRLEQRVLSSFEVSGGDTGIRAAIDAATTQGAASDELAYAELAALVLAGSFEPAEQMMLAKKASLAKDPLFRFVCGVLYERTGRALAKEEFEAALELRPSFASPRLRLLRQSVLAGETEPLAKAKLDGAIPSEAQQALEAWAWAVGRARGRQVGAAPVLTLTSADVSRSLHPAFGALAAMSKQQRGADPTLKLAATDAETPAIAVFWGDVAKSRGDEAALVGGASRALSLAPGFPGALRLLVQNTLRTGRFQELTVATKGLSPLSAKPLLSVIAYETADVATLATLASDPDPGLAGLSRARLTLLRGPSLLTLEDLARLQDADAEHGELCAIDRLLLVGGVKEARVLVGKWPTQGPDAQHAARALRLGRLLRAEGKWAEAEKSLGQAPASIATQIERVLVGAETRENRSHARSLADERAGPAAPLLEAYVVARAGDPDAARARLPATLPGRDATWSAQVVAAMLLAEIGDPRASEAIDFLSKALGPSRDLTRAASRFDETKQSEEDKDKKDAKDEKDTKPPRSTRKR